MKDILKLLKGMGASGNEPIPGSEAKANEVMHPTNTGFGAEFIPSETFRNSIIDIAPTLSTLLNQLPGNQGSNLPQHYVAPVVGLSAGDLLFQGKRDWTTGNPYETEDDHQTSRIATANAVLDQKEFIAEVRISDGQLEQNAVNTEEYVTNRLRLGVAATAESVIINGDTITASTGNVNSDDQAPATTFATQGGALYHASMIDNGLRKLAITAGNIVNIGTLGLDDYSSLLSILGEYASAPEDVLFIQSNRVSLKSLSIAEFLTAQNSGDKATVQSGVRPTPFGVTSVTHRAVPLTEADGKRSGATPSNNIKGQILAVYKPAIQYGFGKTFKLEVVRVPGYGYRILATFSFAFTVIDGAAATPTVAAGINISL